MSILLYVSIAWVTLCVLFVGLDLIFLLIVEHASTVRRQACELADTFDAPAQLEDTVTLAPRDAIPTVDGAVARRTQHTGAVIIRDPRLTRARTLGTQSRAAEETVARASATQEIAAISEAMEVLSAEIRYH
jgi:hypothetical protein